jgi:ABC-type hemin transport system ATPase subunit
VRLFLLVERLVAAGARRWSSTHELYLASRFAQRCLVLHQGAVAAEGAPRKSSGPGRSRRSSVRTSITGASDPARPGARPLVVPWPAAAP